MPPSWSARLRERLPNEALSLLLLRVVVTAASFLWLVLRPPHVTRPDLVGAVLGAVALYGFALCWAVWVRPTVVVRWNWPVLVLDTAFALLIIHLTGGARSVFFVALYVIAALQAYYHGTRQGLSVAAALTLLYLAVAWPGDAPGSWADLILRGGVLLLTATGLGMIGQIQAEERRAIVSLNEELRARDRFLEDVLASIRDGVVVLDPARRIVRWNRTMTRIFGAPADDALGRRPDEVVPELGEAWLAEPLARLYEGRAEEFVLDHVELSGGPRVVAVKGSAIRDDQGAFRGVLLIVADVTARVAAERSLRETERLAALGTLAAGLAHEVNNPIGVIASRAELLLEEAETTGLPTPARADVEVIRTQAQRVARTTHRLLGFARPASGERVPVDLNAVVTDTLALMEAQLRDEHVTLRTTLDPALRPVHGDPALLAQVVLDLLANAREALHGTGGQITVETAAEPGGVRLAVRDSGRGIAPADLPRIFEPFFTTRANGTGLGLAVCYGIVREHGGRLEVASQPGRGAEFVMRLPAAPPPGGA